MLLLPLLSSAPCEILLHESTSPSCNPRHQEQQLTSQRRFALLVLLLRMPLLLMLLLILLLLPSRKEGRVTDQVQGVRGQQQQQQGDPLIFSFKQRFPPEMQHAAGAAP